MANGRGVTLDQWQRQAVLAAAALLRERFGTTAADSKAKAVHDGLLEVVEPQRRALRMQREMSKAAAMDTGVASGERRHGGGYERRRGADRRKTHVGPPMGVERRRGSRRSRSNPGAAS